LRTEPSAQHAKREPKPAAAAQPTPAAAPQAAQVEAIVQPLAPVVAAEAPKQRASRPRAVRPTGTASVAPAPPLETNPYRSRD